MVPMHIRLEMWASAVRFQVEPAPTTTSARLRVITSGIDGVSSLESVDVLALALISLALAVTAALSDKIAYAKAGNRESGFAFPVSCILGSAVV